MRRIAGALLLADMVYRLRFRARLRRDLGITS